MRIAINAACIRSNKILLARKGLVWILPGGKCSVGETDLACLQRECREELGSSRVTTNSHYGDFVGQTPHTKDELCAKVFFADIKGKIAPCAEIVEVGYFSAKEMWLMTLSEITRKIIDSLVHDGHLS